MRSRIDRSPVADWWWTVDRWFLAAFAALMLIGVMLAFAGSPPVAERLDLDEMHFVERQMMFMIPAFLVLVAISFASADMIRIAAVAMLAVTMAMLLATLFVGAEIKGSTRWLRILGVSIQPSEFVKPAFVVVCAWLFALRETRPGFSGGLIAAILLASVLAILISQPDLGQTMLIGATWGALFFMAGMSWLWIILLGGVAFGGATTAYLAFPHVQRRINQFLTGEGDTFQVQKALEAINNGGFIGQGPGEGTIKQVLPDSHTDFIFAVAGEEFGVLVCAVIAGLFLFIVLRGLALARRMEDAFSRYAISGLVIVFGLQSFINMGVNLHLLPAKGMTLPFVSYGGSSLVAVAIGMGVVLALSRKRPEDNLRFRTGGIGALSFEGLR